MMIPLGFLGVAKAASDFELISTTVLGSSAASVTFSGLGTSAAAYKHLQIRMVSTGTTDYFAGFVQYNSDSTSGHYYSHHLTGNGSSISSGSYTNTYSISDKGHAFSVAGIPQTAPFTAIMDILDFQNTSKNKTFRSLSGTMATTGVTLKEVALISHVWLSTAAVTSITVLGNGNSFATGSRFSLYGIKG